MSDNAAAVIIAAIIVLYFVLDNAVDAWKEVQAARAQEAEPPAGKTDINA